LFDLLLALGFAVGFPALTTHVYVRRRPLLQAGHWDTKRREYIETVLWLAGMGAATLFLWALARRDFATLGLPLTVSWKSVVALAVAGGGAALLFFQVHSVRGNVRAQDAVRRGLEPVREYLPASGRERKLFRAVSVSAGIGEELFYRGFLIWYLGQFMPLVLAVLASSALFALAHVMHGTSATVRAGLMGLVLAGLFVFSGALWASMLLHTAVDLSSGELALAAAESEKSVAV
jgi:membrane protease YdiL (CAAX protease family)